MATAAVDAIKVPDGFGRLGIVVFEETATIATIKDSSKAPRRVLKRLYVANVDYKKIARLSALDVKRAGQVVDLGQVDVADIVGAIVVANLSASPVDAFNLDSLSRLNAADGRDCRPKVKINSQRRGMLDIIAYEWTSPFFHEIMAYYLDATGCVDMAVQKLASQWTQSGRCESCQA